MEFKLKLNQINNRITHISPNGKINILNPDSGRVVKTKVLTQVGTHFIKSGNKKIITETVNIPKNEILSSFMNEEEINKLFENNVVVIHEEESLNNTIKSARLGVEYWRWFLIGLAVLIAIEMFLSNTNVSEKESVK